MALQIVSLDRLGVGRHGELYIGAFATVGLQQFFNAFDLPDSLLRQEVEANPAVAVSGYSPQRLIALAVEPYGTPLSLTGLG